MEKDIEKLKEIIRFVGNQDLPHYIIMPILQAAREEICKLENLCLKRK